MNGDLYFEGKKFISSSRAAKISGYVNDYIGQLCRDGKLEARMVGRSWYVCLESLIEHKKTNGTGTRSRGKLNTDFASFETQQPKVILSPKIDQDSVSKLQNEVVLGNDVADKTRALQAPIYVPRRLQVSYPKFISPVSDVSGSTSLVSVREKKALFPMVLFRTTTAVALILVAVFGFRFGLSVSPESKQVYGVAWNSVSSQMQASVFSSVKEDLAFMYNTLRYWITGSRTTVFVLTDKKQEAKQLQPETLGVTYPQQGIVVVPTTPEMDRSAVVAKVKSTFSDEVSVAPTDGESGVITPVFKKSKGDDYLYVLVPIKN